MPTNLRFIALTVYALSSSTLAFGESPEVRQSVASLAHLFDYANALQNDNTENFIMESRRYSGSLGVALRSATTVKAALSECAFTDGAYSQADASGRSAATVWKEIRAEVGAGTLEVYRLSAADMAGYTVDWAYSDSCAVSGASCGVFLLPTGGRSAVGLFVQGDNCQ